MWRLIARPHETPLASSEPAIETRPQLLDDPGGASLDGQRDAPAAVETVEHDLAVAKRGERAAAVLPQEMPTRADRTVRLPRVVDGRLATPRGETPVGIELRATVHPRAGRKRHTEQREEGGRDVNVLGEAVAQLTGTDGSAGDDPRHVLRAVGERVRVIGAAGLAELLAVVGRDDYEGAPEIRIILADRREEPHEPTSRAPRRCTTAASRTRRRSDDGRAR